jgi:RNA polymerase sigma factor (sigma-70 family)
MVALTHRNCRQRLLEESDVRLVELARGGSPEAFEAIVLRYRQPLLRHCRRILSGAEADDAVQDAFIAAYRTIGRATPDLRLGAWLFRLAHNAALGILRRTDAHAPLDEAVGASESADDAVIRQERLQEVLAALSELPETQRRVLVEREFGGCGHREIAARVGRSEGAVRQLLSRARSELRARVAALAPFIIRVLPRDASEHVAGGAVAAKAGAILGVGLAVGSGALIVSRPSASRSPSHRSAGRQAPQHASAWQPVAVASTIHHVAPGGRYELRSASNRTGIVLSLSGDGKSRGSAARRAHSRSHATIGYGSVRTGPTRSRAELGSRSSIPNGSSGPARNGTSAQGGGTPPGSGQGATGPLGSSGQPETGSASGQSGSAPGQLGAAPGQVGSASGQSGSAPGQSGSAPGQNGSAPGQSGSVLGQNGSAPGQSGPAPGQSGSAPGQSGSTPGQSGSARQLGSNTGQAASAPGAAGSADGRSASTNGSG